MLNHYQSWWFLCYVVIGRRELVPGEVPQSMSGAERAFEAPRQEGFVIEEPVSPSKVSPATYNFATDKWVSQQPRTGEKKGPNSIQVNKRVGN